MKQIKIGTCIQGPRAEEWLPGFLGKGFETFSLNFHMSLEGTDLPERQKSCWKEDRSASARLDFTAIRSSIRNTGRRWSRLSGQREDSELIM